MRAISEEQDVVLRQSAVQNLENIAKKASRLHEEVRAAEVRLAREVHDQEGGITEKAYYLKVAAMRTEQVENLLGLLWSLTTTLSVSKGGVVMGEGETSLQGYGILAVGLVDHGEGEWRAHT